jgi:hypothetical protein
MKVSHILEALDAAIEAVLANRPLNQNPRVSNPVRIVSRDYEHGHRQ